MGALSSVGASQHPERVGFDNAPIGVFDSGFGGLTVLRELVRLLPNEDIVFVGDSKRCPYGPRALEEVRGFVIEICDYLVSRGCKMIVIACNTATAAGLREAQRRFDVPIVGVVHPGSRAAVQMTRTRRVGVIATEGTVSSGVYEQAIRGLDAGIDVTSVATPAFVSIAEEGLQLNQAAGQPCGVEGSVWDAYRPIAEECLAPIKEAHVDTLVLGCTHFPLIQPLISAALGPSVLLVSSAEETALEVHAILLRRGELARYKGRGTIELHTTADNTVEFKEMAALVLGVAPPYATHLDLDAATEGEGAAS